MQKLVFLALVALAAIVAAQSDPGCGNPVAEAIGAPTLDDPITRPSGVDICPDVTDSCCSKETFDVIEEIFKQYREGVDQIYEQLSALKEPPFPSFDDLFKQAPGGKCQDSFFQGTDLTCDDVEEFYTNIVKALKKFYADLADNMAKCLTAVLQFFAGIICFVCNALWGSFITIDNDTGNIEFSLADDVCNDLIDGCLPLYEGVQNLYLEILQIASELGPLGDLAVGQFAGTITDICGQDCRNFVCYVLVAGYETDVVPPITLPGDDDRFDPISQIVKATLEAYRPARDLLAKHTAHVVRASRSIHSAQAGVSVYTENGYKATEVGRDSEFETEVESSEEDDDDSATKIVASIFALLAFLALLF